MLQAFLAQQAETMKRERLEARPPGLDLHLGPPTVVAFYPASPSGADDALRALLTQYDSVAWAEGWRFEVYHSGTLRVFDVRSRALYALLFAPNSTGLVLALSGYPPRVWYGPITSHLLAERLRLLGGGLLRERVLRPPRL